MIIDSAEQGTLQWMAARAGVIGASSFSSVITTKGARSEQRQKLLYQLAGERITGTKESTFTTQAMQIGIEREAEARSVFEMLQEVEVQQVGFCYYDERKDRGCSPDGLIGDDGGIEIKSPLLHTHIEYLLSGKLPTAYFQQVQGSIAMTQRKWWTFFSYYPGLKPLILTVLPDEKFIEALHRELDLFCAEVKEVEERLRAI